MYVTGGSNAYQRYKSSVHHYVKDVLSSKRMMVKLLNQNLGESCLQRIWAIKKLHTDSDFTSDTDRVI